MTATNMNNVSDGYHTFGELYKHRHLLFLNLALANPGIAFKTWLNHKKEAWKGWFILGINTEEGQITYHLPEEYWIAAEVREIEYNSDYDGHTSKDVRYRLSRFAVRQVESRKPVWPSPTK
ncbi:hypothetical protein LCGC14_1423060 [marine sediment metagenome]|uniref:WDGH domain-containing protein n=1 Tax=marine sediment metagenome TaxID=412755 RepID=A0A0F9M696_9ZZZZ